ncbi:uncharacterized protein MELLADRAFT_103507 [Melampsora larici-populina 98AG31]|uniref:Uncharacterized protein n=1 Tax=Melampsora larici-populina (strain 98AG31 / pathotype 3-4-7) TaxID=747676 RepID=F4RBK2_MELLP|nr:uncharacterized protein MELLADRAFT_103507 [Melampsora larici-populina 98AG31]EGG10323.1 hypothetical protein MELLADRAFT_103507 [Melampsora larici-populina 98AG31]
MPGPPSPTEVVEFVLSIPLGTNPYRATAEYVTVFLQPCPLPTWSHYVDHCFAVLYLVTTCLALYVIYIRTKTTGFSFFRLNTLGLIWIDRAFHCGSCYVAHSLSLSDKRTQFAIAEIICKDFVLAGRVNICAMANLQVRKMLTGFSRSASGFVWMCICHRAYLKWGPVGVSSNTSKYGIPFNLAPIMNACFVLALIWTIAPVTWAFSRLTIEYNSLNGSSRSVIRQLLDLALTYSPTTYNSLQLLNIMLPLKESLKHTAQIVRFTRLGSIFYMANTMILVLVYIPFVFLIARDLRHKTDRDIILLRQQEQMLMQAILHITMSFLTIPVLLYLGLHGAMLIAGFLMHQTRLFHSINSVTEIGMTEMIKEEI